MPMLRITACPEGPRVHGSTVGLRAALDETLAATPGPVTIMVHGYKYLPGHPQHCPHQSLFAPAPQRAHAAKILSWPKALGIGDRPDAGVGLSFGWAARGSIWSAHARAAQAGHALAQLLEEIRQRAPDRPVTAIAHSLGARVVLSALRRSPAHSLSRAILLAAAEYGAPTRAALTTPAGRTAQVLNVTSRENDLFDFLLERLVPPQQSGDRMLGHGCTRLPNMVTLQLDDRASLRALAHAGYHIASPDRLVCHWSPYLRKGVFSLYRDVLSGALPLATLKAILPEAPAPRWSRLIPRLPGSHPTGIPAE